MRAHAGPGDNFKDWAYWRMCGWMKPVIPKSKYTCAGSCALRSQAEQQAWSLEDGRRMRLLGNKSVRSAQEQRSFGA